MTNYKVAMVITDSFHNDIDGKDYKYGSPNKVDDKSKPVILFYFVDDYERVWDEGNPISYDDEKLKNNASVSLIDYTDKVLLINLFDYESFDETALKFEVGKETSVPEVVDENDHTKEYKFTPTKIVVANSLERNTDVFEEIVSSVWQGYYSKAGKDDEKLPKVAENVQNAESHSHKNYKKCAECSDSVFELEEEICFECSSFGAESEDCEVCYTTVDKGTLNDVQAGRICNECHKMNQYTGGTRTIKTPYNAETFEAEHYILKNEDDEIIIQMTDDWATIDNAKEIIDNLVDKHGFDDEYDYKDLTIYFHDIEGNTLRTLSYNVRGNEANNAIIEWFSDYDYPVGGYTAEFNAEGKPTWAGYCPFCKKWRTTEWSKQDGKDRLCGKRVPDYHTEAGEWAYFYREKFAREGGNWAEPNENICGVVLEKKQSKNAESFGERDSANMRELRKILERELPILVQQINKIEKHLKSLERGTPIEYPIENIRNNLDNMTEVIGRIRLQKIDYLSRYGAETFEDSWEKGVIRLAISGGCFTDEYAEWVERQIDGPSSTLNNPRYKKIIDKRWGLSAESQTFEANEGIKEISDEIKIKVGKKVASRMEKQFPQMMRQQVNDAGLYENPVNKESFVNYVKYECNHTYNWDWFDDMRDVLKQNGYDEKYSNELSHKMLEDYFWNECVKQTVERAKQKAPKIVKEYKKSVK